MTVPEENRRKTQKTQDTVTHPDTVREDAEERPDEHASTTMRQAMEEAGLHRPEDVEGGAGGESSEGAGSRGGGEGSR
ncbi:hypothetical protein [Streptomyces sp. JJ36]|uniref:hypothetical protein n=1 Tax=Streptomyces sp. JJ36 TaxID=2736645 RepID=UPI001F479D70|nr:hypothetical protein [Streptomyces sp. JJ36]MCF6526608.1 hypothetical protein [Streptomyces sp. JJ36]